MITITKTHLSNYLKEINKDSELIESLNHVIKSLEEVQKYIYHISAPYGQKLINQGKFVAFDLDTTIELKFDNKFDKNPFTRREFKLDFTDQNFPLSVVIKNYIELFTTRNLIINNQEQVYKFPINIIKKGDMLGTWESIDKYFNIVKDNLTENWHAVSGRECFVPFFKGYELASKENPPTKVFRFLFNYEEEDKLEPENAIQLFIRENIAGDSDVEFIAFPRFYINNNNNASILQYIFKKAWKDKNAERELHWENLTLKNELNSVFNSLSKFYETQFVKHLMNIINGNHFYLKEIPIDSIEFLAYQKMIEKLNTIEFDHEGNCKDKNLKINHAKVATENGNDTKNVTSVFEIFHPFFMLYDLGFKVGDKGFTFLTNPPMMIHEIPDFDRTSIIVWKKRLIEKRIYNKLNISNGKKNDISLIDKC